MARSAVNFKPFLSRCLISTSQCGLFVLLPSFQIGPPVSMALAFMCFSSFKCQELNTHLNKVFGHLLMVSHGGGLLPKLYFIRLYGAC